MQRTTAWDRRPSVSGEEKPKWRTRTRAVSETQGGLVATSREEGQSGRGSSSPFAERV